MTVTAADDNLPLLTYKVVVLSLEEYNINIGIVDVSYQQDLDELSPQQSQRE